MKRQTKTLPTLKGEPRFLYTSACCNAQATKTPCVAVDKKSAEIQGLGKFRCPTCRKVTKVTRSKNQVKNETL
jgi:hypothetical protein